MIRPPPRSTRTDTLFPYTTSSDLHAQIAASAGIADYFDALHARHFKDAVGPAERGHRVHDLMRGQEMALAAPLLDWLRQRNDVRVLGPTDPAERAPTVAIHTKNKPAAEVLAGLTARGIAAGPGHFYGYRVVQALGPADRKSGG